MSAARKWWKSGAVVAGFVAVALVMAGLGAQQSAKWAGGIEVHEWGTFTSLQDDQGNSVGGINTDDEPVPAFVHEAYPQLVATASELPSWLAVGGKGVVPCGLADATMRLETPVVYFHLPAGAPRAEVDVEVAFNGGWLTQFYPEARADTPGLAMKPTMQESVGKLDGKTQGKLRWQGLVVGGTELKGPATNDPVWVAPRRVTADPVAAERMVGGAEGERFLFYRGIGHVDSPIRVVRNGDMLEMHSQAGAFSEPAEVRGAWLADIREDGTLAYRALEPMRLGANEAEVVGRTAAGFAEGAYSREKLAELRGAVKKGLVREGMNEDEAEGLLATWETSYFRSAGLRVLFMVPRVWTDRVLPLTVSGAGAAEIRRAMVGRIELVNAGERAGLQRIAEGPFGGTQWMQQVAERMNGVDSATLEKLRAGRLGLGTLGVKVPEDYAAYVGLGRFRRALVLAEQKRHPTEALAEFVKGYRLEEYDGK